MGGCNNVEITKWNSGEIEKNIVLLQIIVLIKES